MVYDNHNREQLLHEVVDLRRQIEICSREVKAQKEFFENLFQNSTAPTFVLDCSHRIILWNRACEEMTGIKAADIIGTDEQWKPFYKQRQQVLADLIIDANSNELPLLYTTYAKSKFIPEGLQAEGWYLNIGGAERYISFNAAPIRNSEGELIAAVETFEDITEIKRSEKRLAESEKRYRVLFEESPVAMLVIDPKTAEIVGANDAAFSFYGYTRQDFIGTLMTEIIALPREQVFQMFGEAVPDLQFVQLPNRLANGEFRDVELTRGLLAIDDKTYLFSIVHDVTDRKKAQESAREGEEKLLAITSLAIDAIILIDDQGNICYWNIAAEKMFGYAGSEIMGRNLEIIIPTRFRNAHKKAFEKFVETGKGGMVGRVYEVSALRKNGSEIPIELAISGLLLKGKWHSAGVVRDISERKNLEMQVRQAQKMEAVGRLAGGVAHDYNNMLSVILGYTNMAMDKVDQEDPLYGDLKEILLAAKRSAEITRQLLAFARKQNIAPEILELNNVVEGMLKMLRHLIGEDINLAWLPGQKLWLVKMDPSQIDQILANLCVNARDAIVNVGKITIETRNVNFDMVYCDDHAGFLPGEYVLLAVSDNGFGIDKAIIDYIFEPYFTTKEVGKGTGLGLAMVYGIVKQNGGFINVYSEPKQGTSFHIYLRRHMGQAAEMSKNRIAENPNGHGETVLVVEDEPQVLNLTCKVLEDLGYVVLAAGGPNEALRLAEEHAGTICLLLTDVVMPEMNGRDLAERLQSLSPDLKCLFMSGYTANTIAHQGVLDEGKHFINKPFSRDALAAKIAEVLENGG